MVVVRIDALHIALCWFELEMICDVQILPCTIQTKIFNASTGHTPFHLLTLTTTTVIVLTGQMNRVNNCFITGTVTSICVPILFADYNNLV